MNVAVIGAGPVGILFAKLCIDKGHQVTLIESGNLDEESKLLSKRNYVFKSPSSMPAGVHKIGGGSTLWRARISEFQDSDFLKKGVGGIGLWPFEKDELEMHYAKLYRLLGVGGFSDFEAMVQYFPKVMQQLPNSFELRVFRFCNPDFFIHLFKDIRSNENLKVLEGNFCKSILKTADENILTVELLKKNFNLEYIDFQAVVITCGTLQSTAILQRSQDLMGENSIRLTGKYLMEHLEGFIGNVMFLNKKNREYFSSFALDSNNRAIKSFYGLGTALALKNNSSKNELNVHFELRNPMPHFQIPILLEKYEVLNTALIQTLVRLFIYLERAVSYVLRRLRNYLFKIFQISYFGIYIKSEEIAFEESEVYMPDVDENALVYNHKVSTLTYQKLHDTILEFQREFYLNFKTKIRLYKKAKSLSDLKLLFGANWHPMGTTRMGVDPKNSVVNEDLALHGVPNCYVLSASVFPTGSNSNPTFTTLALASRLSEIDFFNKSN
jgi:hypothetical protein